MSEEILRLVAQAYREGGPFGQPVLVRSFLDMMSRSEVEEQLGLLLDSGVLIAGEGGTVGLAVAVRVPIVSQRVLGYWVRLAAHGQEDLRELRLACIRAELRELVAYCLSSQTLPEATVQRGLQLLGVLAMRDLDAEAMDLMAGMAGPIRHQMQDLAKVPEGSCRSLKELQAQMRRYVTTEYLAETGA